MKKMFLFIFCFFIILSRVYSLDIYSNNAILYNMNDDSILYEKNSNDKVYVASLTKIVTAITIIDNVNDLNEKVTITSNMLYGLRGYSVIGLKTNDTISYMDLLYGLMLSSGADAAQAMAISYSGSNEEFANIMNEEVKKIGVVNSNFSNPYGRDDDNYSTVSDIAIILKYALQNDTFKKIFETQKYVIPELNLELTKTTLLKATFGNIDVSMINGSKTGFTDLAGNCLASTSEINGVKYLLVTTGAPINTVNELEDAVNIYKYYSENYSYKTILNNNQIITNIPIVGSFKKEYQVINKDEVSLYLSNEYDTDKLEYVYSGIKCIDKNITKDSLLGKVDVKYDDETLYSFDVVLDEEILYYNIWLFVIIGVELILLVICLCGLSRIKKLNKRIKGLNLEVR